MKWNMMWCVEKFVDWLIMPASANCFRCGRRLVRGQFVSVKVVGGDTVMLCRTCYEDVYKITYSSQEGNNDGRKGNSNSGGGGIKKNFDGNADGKHGKQS